MSNQEAPDPVVSAVDAAIHAIEDLIRTCLASDKRYRFVRIATLCGQAQELQRMRGVVPEDVEDELLGDNDFVPLDGRRRRGHRVDLPAFGGANPPDMMRDLVTMLQGPMQAMHGQYSAQEQRNAAEELHSLMQARDYATDEERVLLNTKIAKLLDELHKEKETGHADMVHSELLRGHPVEADGGEGHGGHPGEALAH